MRKHLFSPASASSQGRFLLRAAAVCLSMAAAWGAQAQADVKICSASDLHYFAPSLLKSNGAAFQAYLAKDRKLIAESKAITEALVAKIKDEKPAIFIITGDLTKDGEKASHQELAQYLEGIEANGTTKVFVIPGNHDVNNVDAMAYDGAASTKTDSVSPEDFKTIYKNFGYGEATDSDPNSLSYLAKPSANVWILALDACMYEENIARKAPVTEGRIKPATYQWALARLAEAKAAGASVIGMMHHGLTEHYAGQSQSFSEYVVAGWDTLAPKLADAGLKLMFTGHYHANDIARHAGTGAHFVFDIETGSTVTYPCPYRVMSLNTKELSMDIKTKYIRSIEYNTGTLAFPDYAKKSLKEGMTSMVQYGLQQPPYSQPEANAAYLSKYYVNAFMAHYAGDEKIPAEDQGVIDYMNANGGAQLAAILKSLWTDLAPRDNSLFLDLNEGAPFQPTRYTSFACRKTDKIGTYSGLDVFETGGSGLAYIPGSGNEYYTMGDRGPNIDASGSAYTLVNGTTITDTKLFPFPAYNPKIFKIALRADTIAILETLPLKRPNGGAVSGLPNPLSLGNAGEGVLTENTQASKDAFLAKPSSFYDTLGIDCEGIAVGRNNDLWVADEYGVSVWQVSRATGKLLNRYTPFKNMPAQYNNITIDTILAKRRPNRGFESIAIAPNGKVYALLQSAMMNPDNKSRIVRLLEIDPQTNSSKTYAYLLPLVPGVKMKDWKLGDMAAINNNEFLVIAHGATDAIDRIFIAKLDISKASPITAEKYTVGGASKTLEGLVAKTDGSDATNLTKEKNGVSDITPVAHAEFLELYNESYPAYPSLKNIWNPAYEKPEGLAIVNDSTISLTFDNDFGFASHEDADGTATANNIPWEVITYNLKGEKKIKNFTLDSTIAMAMEMNRNIDASMYSVPSIFAFKKAYSIAFAKQDAASIAGLKQAIAGLIKADMPYNVVSSFNGDPKTQIGFAWFTNAGVKGCRVELAEGLAGADAFAAPVFSFAASSDSVKNLNYNVSANGLSAYGFAPNSKQTYMSHKALARGLKPGTTYSYRVGKEGAWSGIGTFKTAQAEKEAFSFVYFTDPQANTEAMFDISAKTTHAAMDKYPQADFWLSCGDLVETSGATNSEWEYERFFESQQDIWMKCPFVSVIGNHDKTANKNFSAHFNTAAPSFDAKMATTPGSNYSFAYGDALFLALNYEDYSSPGYLDSIAHWMNKEVKAHPEAKWRIAFYHKTMYTGSKSHQSDADGKAVREKMTPVFDSLKIDLALQGHDHVYEIIGPLKNKQLIPSAVKNQQAAAASPRENVTGLLGGTFDVSEGTLYFLNNSGGKKKYEPRPKAEMDGAETALGMSNYFGMFSGRFGQTGEPTFSNISVSTDTITISTYTVNDAGLPSLFDEFKITKTIPVASLSFARTAEKLIIGQSMVIAARISPANASNQALDWASSAGDIVRVSNGELIALKAGTALITATTADGKLTASCTVEVSEKTTGFSQFGAEKLVVFPVPTSGSLFIAIPHSLGAQSLSITANNGVRILSRSISGLSELTLDLSTFAAGTYTLQIQTAQGLEAQQIIVK